jgi:hypothetical protein
MPRYFFDFVSSQQILSDPEGVELAGLVEAHAHALRLAHQMRIELPDADGWQIEISDENGETSLSLPSRLPLLKVV